MHARSSIGSNRLNAGAGGLGIPASLSNLTALQHLDISLNVFNGTIPPTLGSLTALTYLDLSGNVDLRGSIPSTLTSLTLLTYFSVATTALDGVLPGGFAGKASLAYTVGTYPNEYTHSLTYGTFASMTVPSSGGDVYDAVNSFLSALPHPEVFRACCSASLTFTSNATISNTLVIPAGMNLNISGNVTACGGQCTLTMTSQQQHIVATDSALSLQGLAFLNGMAPANAPVGGSLLLTGSSTLSAQSCTWRNNFANSCGGAIAVTNLAPGAVRLSDCVLSGNQQTVSRSGYDSLGGSAVYSNGDVQLLRCTFSSNIAANKGTVSARLGVNAVASVFSNNSAGDGGSLASVYVPVFITECGGRFCQVNGELAAMTEPAAINLTGCSFTQNTASGDGGAVVVPVPPPPEGGAVFFLPVLTVNGCAFVGNTAAGSGGALSIGGGSVSLTGCLLQFNSAGVSGGALALAASNTTLTDLTCGNNSATVAGGCVSATDAVSFALAGASTLLGNAAARGGGIAFACTTTPCSTAYGIAGAMLSANAASLQGGGVHLQGGGLLMQDTTLYANVASGSSAQAGGLFMAEYSGLPLAGVVLTRVNFTANAVVLSSSGALPGTLQPSLVGAGFGGAFMVAAVAQPNAQLNISGGCVVSNTAASGAGGYVVGNLTLAVNGTSFRNNTASDTGGALFLQPAGVIRAALAGAVFTGNVASAAGGAITLTSGVVLSSSNSTFSSNAALNGAAFFLSTAGAGVGVVPAVVTLSGGNASGNLASLSGGLFYTDAALPIPAPTCTGACTGNSALNNANGLAGVPLMFNCSAASLIVKPGAVLPPFSIMVFDGQGLLVVSAPLTAAIAANVSATSVGGLSGATVVAYTGGAVTFDSLHISDIPGTAVRLTYTISSPSLGLLDGRSGSLDVVLASCDSDEVFDWDSASNHGSKTCLCRPGNFLNASSQQCQPCSPGSYSPAAGAVACTVNPPGFASATQTTFSSNVTLSGVSSATFGAVQNVTLVASIAASLNVTSSAVAITSVVDALPTKRRFILQSGAAAVAFAVSTTTNAAGLRSVLAAPAGFSSALTSALRASSDPVLSAVTGVVAAAAIESTLVLAAEPCAKGTYLDALSQQCLACQSPLVTASIGATACEPCPPRFAWSSASQCVACPSNSVTSPSDAARCACQAGYYDALFGLNSTSPDCAPCPLGGACNTGFVAAAAGWWREDNRQAVFYQCRVGNCMAENITGPLSAHQMPLPPAGSPSDNCVPGNTGPLCAVCEDGYAMQSGECAVCDPKEAWDSWSQRSKGGLLVGCIIAGLIALAVAFLQPVWPGLEQAIEAATKATSNGIHRAGDAASACYRRCCCRGPPPVEMHHAKAKHDTAPDGEHTPPEPIALTNGDAAVNGDANDNGKLKGTSPSAPLPTATPAAPLVRKHHTRRIDAEAVEHTLASNAAFAMGNVAAFVAGVDGGAEEEDTAGAGEASGVERQTDAMDRLEELLLQFKSALKILVNFFQARGCACRSTPRVRPRRCFCSRTNLIRRHGTHALPADRINLSEVARCALALRLLRLDDPHLFGEPQSCRASCGCLPASFAIVLQPVQRCVRRCAAAPTVLSSEQPRAVSGYTLGLLAAIGLSVATWLLGKHVVAPLALRGMPEVERRQRLARLNSTALARTLLVLYIVYPGMLIV